MFQTTNQITFIHASPAFRLFVALGGTMMIESALAPFSAPQVCPDLGSPTPGAVALGVTLSQTPIEYQGIMVSLGPDFRGVSKMNWGWGYFEWNSTHMYIIILHVLMKRWGLPSPF